MFYEKFNIQVWIQALKFLDLDFLRTNPNAKFFEIQKFQNAHLYSPLPMPLTHLTTHCRAAGPQGRSAVPSSSPSFLWYKLGRDRIGIPQGLAGQRRGGSEGKFYFLLKTNKNQCNCAIETRKVYVWRN